MTATYYDAATQGAQEREAEGIRSLPSNNRTMTETADSNKHEDDLPPSTMTAAEPAHSSTTEPAPTHQPHASTSSTSSSDTDITPSSKEPITADSPDGADAIADAAQKPERPELKRQESRADEFSKLRITIIMFSLCMALFLSALDVTIITTALPTIAQEFQASSSGYTWIGSSYLLANASSTPLWGKFSDIWGRKIMLVLANVVFMVGSIVAALAKSIGQLIVGRVVQGLGGGGLIILVSIAISDLFSMRERPKYYAFVGLTWAVASGVGPIVGGVFTEKATWRWCFWINLPLDGLSLILLIFFLKLETPKTPFWQSVKAIDWIGGLAIVGGVVTFLFGFESAGVTHAWDSAFVLCLIIFGVIMIGLFFVAEWKVAKYPIMPLRLFRDRSNIAAYGVCFLFGFVFIAQSYYLPLYFQTVMGLSPILSGASLFALVIPLSVTSIASGIIMRKTGRYQEVIWVSAGFLCLGSGLLIDLPAHTSWPRVIAYQIICGIGTGPLFQGPLIALQSHLKGYDAAVGTATYGFIRNIATSMSVVLGGVVFQNELNAKQGTLEQVLGPATAEQFAGSSFGSTTGLLKTLPPAEKEALDRAYASSLSTMWIFYVCFAALLIVVSLFITKVELSKEHEKTRTGVAEQERIRKEQEELQKERKAAKRASKGGKDIEKA
ncbi:hypothetical protein LTR70_001183 [Exophiala xenobiotica]|uniref:Major facilitator superfamily (MFS) profile domain-containing protein n=1 Tax=Lithohypha guttulata TaxID=1690604 RepID=A0ABR0K854_9EURO|nr:hypothetical protein LTR24_005768 [Lithohypha guttulata]KAK5328158.1 hypothetical protein LTR70_001183 [Exophiala xenobiotica]